MWATESAIGTMYWCAACDIGEAAKPFEPTPVCFVCDREMRPRTPSWDSTRPEPEPGWGIGVGHDTDGVHVLHVIVTVS